MAHEHHHGEVKNIKTAFFLNLFFTLLEIAGGFFTNSMAILSDALHDLGDCLSLGLAWYFQKIANKRSDKSYSYGYRRFSLMGAIINSIVLTVGSIFILTEAIPRIFHPEKTLPGGIFFLAIIGVLVNGFAFFRLKKGSTLNEKVVSLHFLEDVLGWVAILIGAVIMYFFNAPFIDPVLSVGIAFFVLFNVYKNIRQTLHIILQGIPADIDIAEVSEQLHQLKGIEDIHDLHVWSVDGNYNILTVHVVMNKSLEIDEIAELKGNIRDSLKQKGIQHATIEFETADERCDYENGCD
ncbi:MAG: cation diffusion facilitator family transporter [Bacteroidota bacterium]|nr:cation diffusion facilitator family transporter [Bacteroidota bacterium]